MFRLPQKESSVSIGSVQTVPRAHSTTRNKCRPARSALQVGMQMNKDRACALKLGHDALPGTATVRFMNERRSNLSWGEMNATYEVWLSLDKKTWDKTYTTVNTSIVVKTARPLWEAVRYARIRGKPRTEWSESQRHGRRRTSAGGYYLQVRRGNIFEYSTIQNQSAFSADHAQIMASVGT